MSDNVGSVIFGSGMVENVGVSRWNSFAIYFRSKVTSTSGFHFRFRDRHLSYRCCPMSGRVGSGISKSGMVENVGVAVAIASPSVSVQKLFPLPVPWPTLWVPDVALCRTMSAVSYSTRALSKWHQPIEYRRYVFQFKSYVYTRLFSIRLLEIRMSLDISRDQFYAFVGLF